MKLTLSMTGLAGALLATTALAVSGERGDSNACATRTDFAKTSGKPSIVETAIAAGRFETLTAALGAAGLVETLEGEGPFTVFAPTDEAFARIPAATLEMLLKPENQAQLSNILTYHVVAGRVPASEVAHLANATAVNGQRLGIELDDAGVRVSGARVVTTDIECGNGLIHVIDTVMMPATRDVVATAIHAGNFTTLAAALEAAGLVEALQGAGPFTVFAPTDAAFAALPAGTVESLLRPENRAKLSAILKYHVVPARVYSDQLSGLRESGQEITTLQGQSLTVQLDDHGVRIGGANVLAADLETTNGVIHVVDRVLLPE